MNAVYYNPRKPQLQRRVSVFPLTTVPGGNALDSKYYTLHLKKKEFSAILNILETRAKIYSNVKKKKHMQRNPVKQRYLEKIIRSKSLH